MAAPGNYFSWLKWLEFSALAGLMGGGAKGGEVRRVYYDITKARLANGDPVTSSTSPLLEYSGGKPRIKWPIGATASIFLTAGFPFEDVEVDENDAIGISGSKAYLSQVGTNAFNEGAIDHRPNIAGGGGPLISSPGLLEWPHSASPVRDENVGSFFKLGGSTVTDISDITAEVSLAGATADDIYLHSIWFEVILKK